MRRLNRLMVVGRLGLLALTASLWPIAADGQDLRGNVRGFVFGEDTGAPMDGAFIRLLSRHLESLETTTTDRLGRFAFQVDRPDLYVVVAEKDGYLGAPQQIEVTPIALATVGVTIGMKALGGAQAPAVDSDERTARVRGQVIEASSGTPLEGAEVRLVESGRSALTRFDGRFDLGSVDPGTHRLRVEHLGFESREWATELEPGSDYDVQVPIAQQAIPIEGIEVTVRSRAVARRLEPVFQRMNRNLGGHFLTATDFQRRGFGPLGHYLQGLPSVSVQGQGNRWRIRFRRGVDLQGNPGCVPEIWVDGIRAARAGTDAGDFLGMTTMDVEIVEVFPSPSSIPAEYSTSALCAVGIWTKRGG